MHCTREKQCVQVTAIIAFLFKVFFSSSFYKRNSLSCIQTFAGKQRKNESCNSISIVITSLHNRTLYLLIDQRQVSRTLPETDIWSIQSARLWLCCNNWIIWNFNHYYNATLSTLKEFPFLWSCDWRVHFIDSLQGVTMSEIEFHQWIICFPILNAFECKFLRGKGKLAAALTLILNVVATVVMSLYDYDSLTNISAINNFINIVVALLWLCEAQTLTFS